MLFVLVCALHEPNFPSPYPPAWVASCLEKITLKNCTELKLELRVTLWKINIGSERERRAHQNFSFIFPSFSFLPLGILSLSFDVSITTSAHFAIAVTVMSIDGGGIISLGSGE